MYICRKGHGSAVFVPRVDELGDTDDIAAAGKYREAQDGNCGIIVAVIKIAEKVVVKVFIGVNIIAVDNASGKKARFSNGFLRAVFLFRQKYCRGINQIIRTAAGDFKAFVRQVCQAEKFFVINVIKQTAIGAAQFCGGVHNFLNHFGMVGFSQRQIIELQY